MNQLILIQNLKKSAKDAGLTHKDIADKIGIDRAHVTRILNGNIIPNLKTYCLIYDAIHDKNHI